MAQWLHLPQPRHFESIPGEVRDARGLGSTHRVRPSKNWIWNKMGTPSVTQQQTESEKKGGERRCGESNPESPGIHRIWPDKLAVFCTPHTVHYLADGLAISIAQRERKKKTSETLDKKPLNEQIRVWGVEPRLVLLSATAYRAKLGSGPFAYYRVVCHSQDLSVHSRYEERDWVVLVVDLEK
ncbi:hypothetical protein B0H10DRAFT_1946821 [Mycena sp. CBHHK59/15]|nr:hypothetical protein B0H10DRAFT_1946821 [Mycena sp. CBHHK59/15]